MNLLGSIGKGFTGLVSGFGGPERSGGEFTAVDPNLGRNAAAEMQQGQLLQRLQQQAMGQGPSLAQMQANQALSQGRQQLESMAVTDRRNPALARRNAMLQGGMLSGRIQQQAMMGRVAEQQNAQQALAEAINQARMADLQRAQIVEQARTARYNAMMGTPSSFERGSNVVSSILASNMNSGKKAASGGMG
jgi:hypothetical protein